MAATCLGLRFQMLWWTEEAETRGRKTVKQQLKSLWDWAGENMDLDQVMKEEQQIWVRVGGRDENISLILNELIYVRFVYLSALVIIGGFVSWFGCSFFLFFFITFLFLIIFF